MKKIFFLLILQSTFCILHSAAQVGEWTWVRGSNIVNNAGNFGVQGTPSPTNDPPSLYEACEWTDANGNFWLYGGLDNSYSSRNDLWKYDPAANQWTWMTGTHATNDPGVYGTIGVASPTNRPPSKSWGPASWVDLSGNLWMFGGMSGGVYCDLWKYDILGNVWTWMNGPNTTGQPGVYGTQGIPSPANHPSARYEDAATWTDAAGDLWLFGGLSGTGINDLWKYNISTNEWTWMKGPNVSGQPGTYGTRGIADSLNNPGGRCAYCRWKDNAGNFWLFGGGAPDIYSPMNDLWEYSPATNNWTWMTGSNTMSAPGVYGTHCVTDSLNTPGARFENRATWKDLNGNLWLMGGAIGGTFGNVWNDLWMYCVATNQWTWEGGDDISNPAGSWGVMGVSNPSNKPNGRAGAITWTDQNGHLYLFGGVSTVWPSNYNDLWEFTIDPACGACGGVQLPVANFNSSDTTFCTETGECINFFDHSTGNPTSWHWYFPGANPDSSTLQNPDSICYFNPGTYSVTLVISNAAGSDTLAVSPLIIFATAPPQPTVIVQGGDTLISSHASSYQWYLNGFPVAGATDSFYVAIQVGTYSVRIGDNNGCSVSSSGVLITGLVSYLINDEWLKLFPNPASNELILVFPLPEEGEVVVSDMAGREVAKFELEPLKSRYSISTSSMSNGIYYLQMRNGKQLENKLFVVTHN